jgi:hypothetical protein
MKLTTKKLKQLIREELAKINEEQMITEALGIDDFKSGNTFTGIVKGYLDGTSIGPGSYMHITPKIEDGKHIGVYKWFNPEQLKKYSKQTGGMPAIIGIKNWETGELYPHGSFFNRITKDLIGKVKYNEGVLSLEQMVKIGVPLEPSVKKLMKGGQKELPMSENRRRRIKRK